MTLGAAALAAVIAQLLAPLVGSRALSVPLASALAVVSIAYTTARRPTWGAWLLAIACAVATTRPCSPPSASDHVAALAAAGAERAVAVEARVRDVVPSPRGGARWLVDSIVVSGEERKPLRGRALVYVRMHAPNVAAGTRIAFSGRFRRITGFGNPGELDWPGWNARRGVFVSAYFWDGADVKLLPVGDRDLTDRLAALRDRITHAAVEGHGRGGVLVAALITGERRLLDEDDEHAMNAAGLAHVLAISGLNLSLVGGAVTLFCARLLLRTRLARAGRDTMRGAVVAGLIATLAYAAISGGGVSVARAALMAVTVSIALWRGGPSTGPAGLAAATLVVSFVMPGVACEAGFQLSFAAVAAILLYTSRPRRLTRSKFATALTAVEVSLLCWAVSTPIVAYHFGRVALYGAPATLLTAPLATAIVGAGLVGAAAVACGWNVLAELAFTPAAAAGHALLASSAWISAAPWAELHVVSPGPLLATVLAALPCTPFLHRHLAPRVGGLLAALAVALALQAHHERYRSDSLDAHFLSVGQGDSTVLKLPGGRIAVIDGGPPGRGAMIVAPYLRRLQIARIDYLIVTHAQDDHFGGVGEILDAVDVGELWSPAGRCDVAAFNDLRARAAAHGTEVLEIGGPRLPSRAGPGWKLNALWPDDTDGECDENDRSVVVAVEYAGRRLLLAGDIEAKAESGLVRSQGRRLDADLVAAPHHGSRTSSSPPFVHATSPTWVVASAGLDNRYGFPRAETVARYSAAGATVLTTAELGAVHARIDAEGGITVATGRETARTDRR